jgi:hypothetical protein
MIFVSVMDVPEFDTNLVDLQPRRTNSCSRQNVTRMLRRIRGVVPRYSTWAARHVARRPSCPFVGAQFTLLFEAPVLSRHASRPARRQGRSTFLATAARGNPLRTTHFADPPARISQHRGGQRPRQEPTLIHSRPANGRLPAPGSIFDRHGGSKFSRRRHVCCTQALFKLHAGCRPGRQQTSPDACPSLRLPRGFATVHTLSTRHQRFTCVRLFDTYLIGSSPTFSHLAHHHAS